MSESEAINYGSVEIDPKKPRVAFFGLNYPPEQTAVAPYAGALARELTARGLPVRVLTTHPHYPAWRIRDGYGQWTRDEVIDGVRVRRLLHYVPARPVGIRRLISELSFGVRVVLQRWGAPDVVLVVTPALFSSALAVLRAKLSWRRPKVVVWVQDLYGVGLAETGMSRGVASRIAHLLETWLFRAADQVVAIHDRFADRLVTNFAVPPDRITVVRNWTHLHEMPEIDRSAVREKLGWGEETIVLHSGNMGVKQGLGNVIEAARIAERDQSPIRFVLLGDGSQREQLKAAAKGISTIQFMPPVEHEEFLEALQAADVLLVNELPGVAEMSVPSKLTSYFAAGRPVCAATDSMSISAGEVRAAKAGTVVPADDPEALVAAALDLGADGTRAQQLGEHGRRYRESVLSEHAAVSRFESLLTQVAQS